MVDKESDLLNPKSTPSKAPKKIPDTSGKTPQLRRLNKLPLIIVSIIIITFCIIIAVIASTKGKNFVANANAPEAKKKDATNVAEGLLKNAPSEGVIGSAASTPKLPLPDESTSSGATASAVDLNNLSSIELDPNAPTTLPPPQQISIGDIDQTQQQRTQSFAEALRAKTKVSDINSSSTVYSNNSNDRDNLLMQIEQVQQEAQNAVTENNQQDAKTVYDQLNSSQNSSTDLSKPPRPSIVASNSTGTSKWDLNTKIVKAKPATLMTGSVIPAIAVTGINSDLPGQIMAQVSQNVYDTLSGQRILIPQGSKLIGSYDSGATLGQNRLFIAWNRIIFPNGTSLDIGSMPGSSGAGYSGVRDRVNNHYMKNWGNALMLSVVGASMAFGTDRNKNNDNNNTTFSGEMSSNLASTFGQVVSQSIQKHMNLSPTLNIRPGYRFNVIVTKDIPFNYQ